MTEWKMFSLLVELDSDTPLNEVQDQLVDGGDALQALLVVEHPNADAVLTSVQDIKSQLDFDDILDTWVTAHVRVGKKNKLIANKCVRQVSPSIFFHLTTMLTCM
jgi:hypothetical protein